MLSSKIGLPVELENDANCYALGEGWGGAARGMTDFVLFTLGTGIGGGIVLGGRILKGFHGMAGELGHLVVGSGEPWRLLLPRTPRSNRRRRRPGAHSEIHGTAARPEVPVDHAGPTPQ